MWELRFDFGAETEAILGRVEAYCATFIDGVWKNEAYWSGSRLEVAKSRIAFMLADTGKKRHDREGRGGFGRPCRKTWRCGHEKTIENNVIIRGVPSRCRTCYRIAAARHRKTKKYRTRQRAANARYHTPTRISWEGMRERCSYTAHPAYDRYGGRGITACSRWESFENFLADMGPRPQGKTLDRVNPDGNYAPSNCRWATRSPSTPSRPPACTCGGRELPPPAVYMRAGQTGIGAALYTAPLADSGRLRYAPGA